MVPAVLLILLSSTCFAIDPEILLDIDSRIQSHGYPVKTHQVQTEDGYLLNLFNIPNGNKSAILLVHGQGGSPKHFIALGRKTALAYYLSDRGFDVWLFCARGVECGNKRKHSKYDWNRDQDYWDFSAHEIALYDLPAAIDVVLEKTGQKKIFVLGFSIGASEALVLLSEKPAYNDKVKLNVNYAPLVFMKNVDYPFLETLAQFSSIIKNIYRTIGLKEFLPKFMTELLTNTMRRNCGTPQWYGACKVILWIFGSHPSFLIENDVIVKVFDSCPRLSLKQVLHSFDIVDSGDFKKYKIPESYNLSAVTVPNALFYGATDSLTMPQDTDALLDKLPNTLLEYTVGPKFVHMDFMFAKNATKMLYEPTVKLLRDFDRGILPPANERRRRMN